MLQQYLSQLFHKFHNTELFSSLCMLKQRKEILYNLCINRILMLYY